MKNTLTILVALATLTINSVADCKPLPYTYESVVTNVVVNGNEYTVSADDVEYILQEIYHVGSKDLISKLSGIAKISFGVSQTVEFVTDGFIKINGKSIVTDIPEDTCPNNYFKEGK